MDADMAMDNSYTPGIALATGQGEMLSLPALPTDSEYGWAPPWLQGDWGDLRTYAVTFNERQIVETIAGLVFEWNRSDLTVVHSTDDWFVYRLPAEAPPRVQPDLARWWARIDSSWAYLESVPVGERPGEVVATNIGLVSRR